MSGTMPLAIFNFQIHINNMFKKIVAAYRFLPVIFLAYFILAGSFRLVLATEYDAFSSQTFLYGLRMDMIIISIFSFITLFLFTFNLYKAARIYISLLFCLFLLFELINLNFFEEFNLRINYLFVENLPFLLQIMPMLIKDYGFSLLFAAIFLPFLFFQIYKRSAILFDTNFRITHKILLLPVFMLLLIVTGRGSFDRSPPNASYYSWSTNNTLNEVSNNSVFSLLSSSFYQRDNKIGNYGKHEETRTDHFRQTIHSTYSAKKHIVLTIMESFGKTYVGSIGGTNSTPEFDRLSKQGLFLSNMYSSSNRTNRGVEAIISSTYPFAGSTYLKLPDAQHQFWTLASELKQKGYRTVFLYGGDSNFDNMRAFLLSNGYGEVLDASSIDIDAHEYAWGYADEDVFARALDILKASDQPLFLTVLTLSSHKPFDFPLGKTAVYENAPLKSFENSIKYADWAIGWFQKQLEDSGFFNDSLLVLVADHNAQINGPEFIPVKEYRIPALFLGHDIPHQEISTVTHQADIAPTLLAAAGMQVTVPAQGFNMLESARSRALITRQGSYAYLTDEGQVIFRQDKKPLGEPKLIDEGLSLIYNSYAAYKNKTHQ